MNQAATVILRFVLVWGLQLSLLDSAMAAPLEVEREWADKVAPLLDRHCFKCHGGVRQRGDLDLRSLEKILQGGESGPAVTPGKPEESNLFKFVHAEADPHMPPKKQLGPTEISMLKAWIAKLPTTDSLGIKATDTNWNGHYMAALVSSRQSIWTSAPGTPGNKVIDRFIELGWQDRNATGSKLSGDAVFVRRVYLDLAGRIPSVAEAQEFIGNSSEDKREQLVEKLLAGDDYPRHMREIFDVVLMERKGGRAQTQREENKWYHYLEESFRSNRAWNQMVREIILARTGGTNSPGAAWFLYERRNNHQSMAEAVAPIAFGVQIGCAQCHNHPMAWEIEQRHYWGLVAAFNRSKNVDSSAGVGVAESAIGGFVSFADLRKESQPALLAFLNGTVVNENRPAEGEKEKDDADLYVIPPPPEKEKAQQAALPKFSRREALSNAATENNPQLARAFVNRVWAMLLGRGLVHPVDRLDSLHLPSHPDLLDWLSRDFEQNRYDVKRLIRQIVLSRTYQLDSQPAPGSVSASPQSFARALDKPLSAEQLFRSVLVATGNSSDSDGKVAGRPETEYRRAFIERFPELFAEEYNASLQQATFISNSSLLDQLLSRATGNTTDRVLQTNPTEAQVLEAFQVVLGRAPADDELAEARRVLERRPGEAGVRHLLWALIASAEFQLNH